MSSPTYTNPGRIFIRNEAGDTIGGEVFIVADGIVQNAYCLAFTSHAVAYASNTGSGWRLRRGITIIQHLPKTNEQRKSA